MSNFFKKIFVLICGVFLLSSTVFAYDIEEYMSDDGQFESGEIYTNSGTLTSNNGWASGSPDYDYECSTDDYWMSSGQLWFAKKSANGNGKGFWIQWSGNIWYFVTETEPVKYSDDEGRTKSISGAYSITNWVQGEPALIDGLIYEFDEAGVCLNGGSSLFPNIKFDNKGKAKNFVRTNVDIEDLGLDVYEKGDWDGKTGTLDKENNEKLKGGYFIQDNGGEKYTLFFADASGNTQSKKTGNAGEIDAYLRDQLKGNAPSATTEGSTFNTTNNSTTRTSSSTGMTAVAGNSNAKITISFNAGGGSGSMNSVSVNKGNYTLPSCNFTKSGYTFNGWIVSGGLKQPGQQVSLSSSVTITASWKKNASGGTTNSSNSSNSNSDVRAEIRSIISEIDALKSRLNSLLNSLN